jgi:hypothetical protein
MFAFHVIDEFHGVHVHVQRLLTEGVRLQLGAKIVFRDTLKQMNLELVLYAEFGQRLIDNHGGRDLEGQKDRSGRLPGHT